jgi:uncharacterized protein (DUF433 family)
LATPTKTLRLRPALRSEIDRLARRSRRSFSEVAQDLLDEAIRMRQCPGIHFADEPAGREAKVTGTGLGVWEAIDIYKGLKEDERKLRRLYPELSPAQVKAALLYYERHTDEIDDLIAENRALYRAGKAAQARLARRA